MEINNKVNQYPDYFYAGFWIRFLAYIVDLLMIGSIVRLINGPLSIVTQGVTELSVWYFSIGAAVVIYPLYFVLFTKFTRGQTLGKLIFGIRVVSFTEYEMTWKTVVVRELFGRYIHKMLLFLYLIAAFTPKKQHVADMLTDTGVINESYLQAFRYGMKFSDSLADATAQAPQQPQQSQPGDAATQASWSGEDVAQASWPGEDKTQAMQPETDAAQLPQPPAAEQASATAPATDNAFPYRHKDSF